MSVQRKEKARFRVVVHEPIRLVATDDREADIEAGVRRHQRELYRGSGVREHPILVAVVLGSQQTLANHEVLAENGVNELSIPASGNGRSVSR